jgi:hypothetical protein
MTAFNTTQFTHSGAPVATWREPFHGVDGR